MEEGHNNDDFNILTFLDYISSTEKDVILFLLECLDNFFSNLEPNSLKILDYGCGPSLANEISATAKASEIVMADYCTPNREFVKKWLQDPAMYDFSSYFKHVVQNLEGGSEQDTARREVELRNKVKAVVPCDITKDQFIAEGYEGPYDVVMSFLCLENAAMSMCYA